MMLNNKKSGFTLMELLVVMMIILILVGLAVPSISAYLHRAKVANTKNLYTIIGAACDAYKKDNGKLPPSCVSKEYVAGSVVAAKYNGPSGKVTAQGGGRSLLVDYLVGPTDFDGVIGPGMKEGGTQNGAVSFGKKIEPYNGLHDADYAPVDGVKNNYAFLDPWGNDIYYYKLSLVTRSFSLPGNKKITRKQIAPNDNTWISGDTAKDGPDTKYKEKLREIANRMMKDEDKIFEFILLSKSDKHRDQDWDELDKTTDIYLKTEYTDISNISTNHGSK